MGILYWEPMLTLTSNDPKTADKTQGIPLPWSDMEGGREGGSPDCTTAGIMMSCMSMVE